LDTLAEARAGVADGRYVWCVAADGFETTVSHRRGLILGGAWSPHFLRDGREVWWDIPWTVRLWAPRVVAVERAVTPLPQWLPLMEAVVAAGESLLVVTREMPTELLQTFVVNSLKKTLACCAVRGAESLSGYGMPAAGVPWDFADAPPKSPGRLPQAAEAWVRRTSTVLFPASPNDWRSSVSDVAVISVGGEDHEDQQDRLRFLVKAIQQQ
jgi:hypothetical protein